MGILLRKSSNVKHSGRKKKREDWFWRKRNRTSV